MSSTAFQQGRFLHPEDRQHNQEHQEHQEQGVEAHESKGRVRRDADLFDAVAGRVSYQGFLPGASSNANVGDRGASASATAVPPEEVLFRRKNAPSRDAEDDFYWADRHLGPTETLPGSELLKAIHAFTADYFSRTTPDGGQADSRTMDETALLALGILLEESVGQVLGETGDLAFLEGERLERPRGIHARSTSRPTSRTSRSPSGAPHSSGAKDRSHKRRKIDRSSPS